MPRTTSTFCSGNTSATISSMPTARPTARAVVALSPVTMTTRRPPRRRVSTASRAAGLTRIRDAEEPGQTSVDHDAHDGLALFPEGRDPAFAVRRLDAELGQEAGVADDDGVSVDSALGSAARE